MKIFVTGADGFIGKNLLLHFREMKNIECVSFIRSNCVDELPKLLEEVDWVFHLAGINRAKSIKEFATGNVGLTESLCTAIQAAGRSIPVVYTSSIQVNLDNDYGLSKLAAEKALLTLHKATGNPVFIYRLPNVFGKLAALSSNKPSPGQSLGNLVVLKPGSGSTA